MLRIIKLAHTLIWACLAGAIIAIIPLALAARYTEDRAPNFDIYLPRWLAQHNKALFGTLFVVGELVALARWLGAS